MQTSRIPPSSWTRTLVPLSKPLAADVADVARRRRMPEAEAYDLVVAAGLHRLEALRRFRSRKKRS